MTLPALLSALALSLLPTGPGDDWTQWRGSLRDGVWRESGITETLPDAIEPRWRVPIGSGYSGPTVADGKVYVMDRLEDPNEVERIHCFGWEDGATVWTHEYACKYRGVSYKAGPRCSVQIHDGLAYALGTMGDLHCLDAATGEVRWSHDLNEAYQIRMPIWGIAASPVIEGGLIIVPVSGDEDAYLVAFDKKTGVERWRGFSDNGNYSAPIIIDQAGARVLVIVSGERVLGAAPATGDLLWEHPFKSKNMPLTAPSPVLYKDYLFVTGFYDGCLLLRLDAKELAVEKVWRLRGRNELVTEGLHSTISTPFIREGHIYGVDSYGQLRCLDLVTGERLWEDLTAVPKARWANIHFVQHEEHTWMFNERGELIIADLTPEGFQEIDRAQLIEPTFGQLNDRGGVCWTHPAFAYQHIFIRNDEEILCADLSQPEE